jgi:hypothetical protein
VKAPTQARLHGIGHQALVDDAFFTTTGAGLDAALVGWGPAICHLKGTFRRGTWWIWTEPLAAAFSVLVTEGWTSQSTATSSAASLAADWLSAMTMATGSPT